MSLSKARLGRMRDVMAGYVERGEVHVDAIGTKAVAGGEPIQRDTIVRIRVADQADRGRGDDDPGGGMQAAAR